MPCNQLNHSLPVFITKLRIPAKFYKPFTKSVTNCTVYPCTDIYIPPNGISTCNLRKCNFNYFITKYSVHLDCLHTTKMLKLLAYLQTMFKSLYLDMAELRNIEWKPPINKWYNVGVEPYKLILSEAKERFEDVIAESESITEKSIKILTALVGLISFFVGYLIKNDLFQTYIFILAPFVFFDVLFLYQLITPKEIVFRGLPPEESFPKQLDNPEDSEKQIELVYYQCVVHYQNNTKKMVRLNNGRITYYKIALILFFIVLAIIATFLTCSA